MAQKKITEMQLRSAVTDDLNIPSDDGIQSYRVTALQMKNYVLAQVAPPKITEFLSSGTFTKTGNPLYIIVEAWGAGAGGAGSFNGSGAVGSTSGNGGSTSFGGTLIVAEGGFGVACGDFVIGGAGGGASGGGTFSGLTGTKVTGGYGGTNLLNNVAQVIYLPSAIGGNAPILQGGAPAAYAGNAGSAAVPNSGGGGSGGGAIGGGVIYRTGAGGGAGQYIRAKINNPATTYAVVIGAGGAAGSAGAGGFAGGAGGSGRLIVTEYYQ